MRMCVPALILCAAAAGVLADDWNQWRGPNRDGLAPKSPRLIDALPNDGLKPLWKFEGIQAGGTGGFGSPVVADGRVYVYAHEKVLKPGATLGKAKFPFIAPDKRGNMTDEEYRQYEVNRRNEDEERSNAFTFTETLYCIDARTGQQVYKASRPSIYTRFLHSGTPAAIGGKVYVLGAGRTARCYNAADGSVAWETRLPGEFRDEFYMSSFAIADGVALVMSGELYGLDAATGKILWTGDNNRTRGTHTSPVVWQHGDRQYVIVNAGGSDTACFEPRTGRELWRVRSEANQSTPIVIGDRLLTYGSSRKRGVVCFQISPSGAQKLWQYQGAGDQGSSPVVVGDYLFVQGERRLGCASMKDGEEMWATQLNMRDPRYTSLIAADGKVFYACEGILCFQATGSEYRELFMGLINDQRVLATEATQHRLLNMAELERAGGKKAENAWRSRVESKGPAKCTTPAFWDGKLYVRVNNGIVCYDLSATQRT